MICKLLQGKERWFARILKEIAIRNKRESLGIAVLLSVFFLLGLYYTFDNPLYCKPDEAYHQAYVMHLRDGQGLPVIDTSRVGCEAHTPVEMEGHQPPLYYATVALITKVFGMQDRCSRTANPHFLSTLIGNRSVYTPSYVHSPLEQPVFFTGRLVSLFCGSAALACTYLLARRFLSWPLALLTTAFMGLNPQFIFIATSFSNDMAGVATIHLGLWQLGSAYQEGLTRKRALILGSVIGLATLTKLGGLGLIAPLGIIALWEAWKSRRLTPLLWAASSGLLTASICSWWFWRNWIHYGDPLATNLLPILIGYRTTPVTWGRTREFFEFLWKAYWLDFSVGGILFAAPWFYWCMGILCVLAIIGAVSAFIRQQTTRPFWLLICGWWMIVFISLLKLTSGTAIFMGGGRLLFPAASAIAALLAVGLTQLFANRITIPAVIAAGLGLMALLAPSQYLHVAYPKPTLVSTLTQPPEYAIPYTFGEQTFELLGYDLTLDTGAAPQTTLTLTYYWRAHQNVTQNFSVFIHLMENQDQPVILTQTDTYPDYGNFPTSVWQPGQIFIDRLQLDIPPLAPDTHAAIFTGLYDLHTMGRVPVFTAAGEELSNWAVPIAELHATATGDIQLRIAD